MLFWVWIMNWCFVVYANFCSGLRFWSMLIYIMVMWICSNVSYNLLILVDRCYMGLIVDVILEFRFEFLWFHKWYCGFKFQEMKRSVMKWVVSLFRCQRKKGLDVHKSPSYWSSFFDVCIFLMQVLERIVLLKNFP